MKAISGHILELTQRGGTNWKAGFEEGVNLFASLGESAVDSSQYENRIIFLTDAMPNTGELRREGLFGMIRSAADKGIYTSILGVGVDFNPELVEYVSKTRGANYFSIQSAKEFKKRLADEFDFMVTPLVFDLELRLESGDFTITGVYGSPDANQASGEIMKINTLFPSAADEEQVKGGVVLIKLKKTGSSNSPIKLTVRYKDRSNKPFTTTDTVTFAHTPGFDNLGIRKAVLLTEYVSLIKNWLIDANKGCNDKLSRPPVLPLPRCGLINPQTRPEISLLPTWERKSCPLDVSEGYKNFFTMFSRHFKEEMDTIKDQTLAQELKVLEILTGKPTTADGRPVDDWKVQ
jgi:Ca-activated chloride channel family protein